MSTDQTTRDASGGIAAPALRADGVRIEFRGRHGRTATALDGVDLDIRLGEILAIVGESGSGKTTLARTLMGLERPVDGAVEHHGERLAYDAKRLHHYRRRVQLVLQDSSGALNPRQTVYESVAEGLRLHRVAHRQEGEHRRTEVEMVADALSGAGLRPPENYFLRYPHELSGGQRQRVLIAGALALEPEVLIADEPASSLDASLRGEILALLLKLREERGVTLAVVTHDVGLAWNVADRIVVMHLGRIIESGTTEEVLQNPQHPYTRALLSVVPEAGGRDPIVLSGEIPDPTNIPTGCRFNPRCPELASGRADAVTDRCRSSDPAILPGSGPHAAACWLTEAQ
ncbi:ABC transporter ATP-binding protein [Mariniluteicoccus flavus]